MVVIDAVAEMDLEAFYAAYRVDGRSRPPYDPAMMVALLLYAYTRGIRSLRAIERACEEDVAVRVLAAQQRPNYATIARFVRAPSGGNRRLVRRGARALRAQRVGSVSPDTEGRWADGRPAVRWPGRVGPEPCVACGGTARWTRQSQVRDGSTAGPAVDVRPSTL